MPTGSFTHIVMTYDSNLDSKNIKLYENGVRLNADQDGIKEAWDYNQPLETVHDQLDIGYTRTNWSNFYFDGQIDEVRIYNRALSPREVKKLYEWAPGPVAW